MLPHVYESAHISHGGDRLIDRFLIMLSIVMGHDRTHLALRSYAETNLAEFYAGLFEAYRLGKIPFRGKGSLLDRFISRCVNGTGELTDPLLYLRMARGDFAETRPRGLFARISQGARPRLSVLPSRLDVE